MNYQELLELVGGNNPKTATYQDIISGIQSQYRPQTQFAPTRSLLDSIGVTVPDQPRIAYGSLLQAQPRVLPEKFDITKYVTKTEGDTTTGLFGGDGGGGDGGNASTSGNSGFSIGPDGQAVANTVSQGLASVVGMVTGLPMGLVASITNAANTAAANAANAAMAQADVDSTATTGNTATSGASGTGAAAAAAGTAAAAAASAAGMSDAAAAAAGQAAADAAVGGASAAAAAAAGAAAAAAADSAGNSGEAGDTGPSGVGDGVGDGTAFAKGGLVTMNRLMGSNPMGKDDGYASLQSGEYVIKKNAVDKYGEEFLGLLNSGKLTKKQIKSLL
tara:strand:- start:42 stop:1037 length:996 start_codon:yes stop_codon:yes gene_type:complete